MENYPVPLGKKGGSLRSLAMYILVVFSLLAVFGLFFLPLWKLAEVAFVEEGRLSLRIFWELLTDTKTLKVIWDTIYINVLSSFFATVIGVVMAYFVAYADIRGKKFIHYALLLPLIIPGYIITLAWMQFFAKSGFVASLIQSVVPGVTMPNIYSYWGIIFVFSVTKYPLIYTLTLSTFRKISTDMELAAAVSGCNKIKTFFKVTLPMSLFGVANGLLLVFISCLDNFGTVAFLGIPARITVLSTDIYQAIISFSGNSFGEAAAESVILGVIGVLSSLILWKVAKMFQTMQTDMEDMSPRFFLRRKKLLVEILMWLAIFIINFVPMLTLIVTAFMKGIGGGYGRDNMTLENFAFVFSNAKSFNAIKNSIFLGIATALICVVLGTIVAYLMVRRPSEHYLRSLFDSGHHLRLGADPDLGASSAHHQSDNLRHGIHVASVLCGSIHFLANSQQYHWRAADGHIYGGSGGDLRRQRIQKVDRYYHTVDLSCHDFRHGLSVSQRADGADHFFAAMVSWF